MTPTRRRVATALAIAAGALVVTILAAGESPTRHDPHGPVRDSAQLARVLRAVEATGTSPSSAELIAEGRRLFNSGALAKLGEACSSCHTLGTANAGLGTTLHPTRPGDFSGPRDPPSLLGAARTEPFGWAGQVPTLREMVTRTIINHFKDGATQPAEVTARQAQQLAAYVASLRAPVSDFDAGTLSPAARRGEQLFQGKGGCIACHGGPDFTDNGLHNTLVPQAPGGDDPGAASPPGAFNTPQLRDVRNSAPYMHNGVLRSLREVIDFYNARSSVSPLNLTDAEVDDLVAYLESL